MSVYENKELKRDIIIQEALPLDELCNPDNEILDEIKNIDLLKMTPIDAINFLYKIKNDLK